jgi:gluconate 2-dehydrogenase gamma chain
MKSQNCSRRQFLVSSACGLSTAWVALHWPAILSAQQHAHEMAASSPPATLQFLSRDQAADVEAIAAQIIPTDETPGAREAHVVYFIDRALITFDRARQADYSNGLADLQTRTKAMFPAAAKFSQLSGEQQVQLLSAIQHTPFFDMVRVHTIMGFLSNPEYGGNDNKVGWKLIGFEDNFYYQPPFGYYDSEYAQSHSPKSESDKS